MSRPPPPPASWRVFFEGVLVGLLLAIAIALGATAALPGTPGAWL